MTETNDPPMILIHKSCKTHLHLIPFSEESSPDEGIEIRETWIGFCRKCGVEFSVTMEKLSQGGRS